MGQSPKRQKIKGVLHKLSIFPTKILLATDGSEEADAVSLEGGEGGQNAVVGETERLGQLVDGAARAT